MRVIKPYGYSEIEKEKYNVEYYIPKETLLVTKHLNNPKFKKRLFTSVVNTLINKLKPPKKEEKLSLNKKLSAALHLCLFYSDISPYKDSTDPKDIIDFLGCEFDPTFLKSINSYNDAYKFYAEKLTYTPNFFKGNKIAADSKIDDIIRIVAQQYEKKLNGIKGSINNGASPFTQDFNQIMYQYYFDYHLKQGKFPDFSDLDYPLKQLITEVNELIKQEKDEAEKDKQYRGKPAHYKAIAPIITNINKQTQGQKRHKNDQDPYDPKHKDNQLYFYKMLVKEIIKLDFPAKTAKRRKIHELDPLKTKDIQKKIEYKLRNKLIMQFIRMGKFIFYATKNKPELDYKAAQETVQGGYFDSQTQHEIKQKESFARQNLSAISFASMSLKNIMDKDDELSKDVLGGKFEDKSKNFDHETFRLFYGAGFNVKDEKSILEQVRNYTSGLRNNLFHFKDVEIQAIYEKIIEDDTLKQIIKNYIDQAKERYQRLIRDELKTLKIHQSSWNGSNQTLLKEYFQQGESTLILPSFQKLLRRAENIKKTKTLPKSKSLITSVNDTENLRHALFKRIYENGFSYWFKSQEIRYQGWIDEAMKRTIEAAKKLSKRDEKEIKVSRIPKFDHKNIQLYFAEISKLIAMENSIQQKNNRYLQNQDQAKKNSNFIHNFILDFYILAFQAYLKDKELQELYQITIDGGKSQLEFEKWRINQNLGSIMRSVSSSNISEKSYLFYLYLHLLSGDHLNHLSMQLTKLATLTHKQEILKTIEDYQNIINFTLKIKGAQLMNITSFDDLWKDFYTKGTKPNNVNFGAQSSIIELNRFIGLSKIKALFQNSNLLASQEEVDLLAPSKAKQNIEHFHKELTTLHKKSIEDKGDMNQQDKLFNNEDIETYKKYMNIIENYKHIQKKITCQYPVKLHQLILAIAGRLVGYINLFERDLYFYLVGVNYFYQGDALQKRDDLIEKKKQKEQEYYEEQRADLWKYVRNNTENQNLKNALAFFEQSLEGTGFNKIKGYRANIAHFNYLIDSNRSINFTSFINDIRKITSYDRKLKNAVSKSIMDILDQYGLILTFTVNDHHQLELEDIKAKDIEHLKHLKLQGESKIIIKTEHEDYIALIKQIFMESKSQKTSKIEAQATA